MGRHILRAATSGPTIFVSFAGPVVNSKGTPVTDAMGRIFPILVANNYTRAMVLGTCSFPAQEDKGALKWKLSIILVKIIGGSAYEEFKQLGTLVTSQDVSKLRWTLYRVPFLNNGPSAPVMATYTGSGNDGMTLSRKSLANWLLGEMLEGSYWVGKAPVLSD
ncbi:hypothetical protein BDV26DRAFT_286081 [Aspergillus bertholletiae]|uniref:NAD(P)-binding domain-containing protein n=1 Tax=Aspergillus bertholletiae TaxID=1226010 RepID=A0A5N7AQZ8_9EURO|nr:hypothetical protein BDV26DRAFT_286081 [Aspergillus bertholletiae]